MSKKKLSSEKIKTDPSSKPPKNYLIFLIFFFIALSFFSELIYTLRNRPPRLASYYLKIVCFYSKRSDTQKAIRYFNKAAEVKIEEIGKNYPDLAPKTSITPPSIPDNSYINQLYLSYLQNLNSDELGKVYPDKWAKHFYNLGLMAYRNNEPDITAPFWETAIYLAPEWSYFHVELANFYLIQGNANKAREQIEFCLQFQFANKHCREFLRENILTNSMEAVGIWEEQINKI